MTYDPEEVEHESSSCLQGAHIKFRGDNRDHSGPGYSSKQTRLELVTALADIGYYFSQHLPKLGSFHISR